MINVVFILPDGTRKECVGQEGESILTLAKKNDIPLEGSCESSLACSTCHVIIEDNWYGKLPESSEEEEDLLDLAFGLTSTSRLGCQIILTQDMDGIVITVPKEGRNILLTNNED
ncbi:MAG: ferredoxin, 2FE-2S [Candidatus Xenolissoclinum pacificiensis L6]|uniref:Adrenodoxin-like protein n=1 Tax=Candidatus Xenolissoclinum pacificiensis L6 TaxID=1401685 RepID=W2V1A0_9RICK|nr:MAG: ferredoxin, 2FE-2S [Candidatus Xenolissoclinum pacificiensis L6]